MATMEELLADVKRNAEEAKTLFDPSGQHLANVVWPFLEALVETQNEAFAEMGAELVDLQNGESELLHAETSDQILATIAMGAELAVDLKRRIGDKPTDMDKKWLAKIVAFGKLTAEVVPLIEGITIEEEDDDAEEVDDAGGEK